MSRYQYVGLLTAALFLHFFNVSAATGGHDPHQVNRVHTRPQVLPDVQWQADLRTMPAWKNFVNAHPQWAVEFNEASWKPHRAYGPAIPTVGADADARAWWFIQHKLAPFGIPVDDLVHMATLPTAKHTWVHFKQVHAGLPVLHSHLLVKLDAQGRVVSFGTEVHDGIVLDLTATVGAAQAAAIASGGLPNVTQIEHNGLRILPVPGDRTMEHRLVQEVIVHTDDAGHPGRYQCWVDAHTGMLWYRWNQVVDHRSCTHEGHDHGDGGGGSGADAQVDATTYTISALHPASVEGLPELRLTINGDFFFTGLDGSVATGIPGPVQATVQLRGRWANVTTNGTTPSFNVTLQEGANAVNFDNSATIQERSAYWFVQRIHDHMKQQLPQFTGLDIVLPTRVDLTTGTCNAYYDGSSINFYAQGGGCRSLATMGDVVYHEYGHGINDKYYQSLGASFNNGAMNEGYADVWALTLTDYPILAQGWQLNSNNSFIRRYDIDPKVYPVDLVGQVHADGEIIAGAWWDTYQLLGNMGLTLELFREAYNGLQATMANGQEGVAYRDVLIDALQADDDDGNIANGTPNGGAIVEGFAIHGITLLSNVNMTHTSVETAPYETTIPISANVTVTFPGSLYLAGVRAFYRVNNEATWNSVLMTNAGGNIYTADIPGQPEGTVIYYYLAVEDVFGQLSSVLPIGAAQADPNLPYNILVGYELHATEDVDMLHQLGNWTAGLPSDNATTGQWEATLPVPSFSGSVMVQPGFQNTPGGEFCWVTQNASGPNAGMGEADVDGGTTTLISSNINLTGYTNPTFTYYRWYINNPPNGANPNADWWQVYISNNGGSTWVPIEDTKTSDRSWRRHAFRVKDYVTPTAQVRLKFHASDSIRPGQNLDGGSLVEAAVDDVQLWDEVINTQSQFELPPPSVTSVYPDPAVDELNVLVTLNGSRLLGFEVVDMTGRIVLSPPSSGPHADRHRIDVSRLADGHYVLRLVLDSGRAEHRFSVVR
ncbi:MAG: T9SS type A sorting domain-containing protein [Flavobacteriales bacterium]|nr:T9SS type A sorting domain-containing protein [Flavobacteriales bacterium]